MPSSQAFISAQTTRGVLEIPLVFRKTHDSGHAFARVTKTSPTRIVASYVDGDPAMRAVLYEGLRSARNKTTLYALFEQVDPRELLFSLRFTTSPVPRSLGSENTHVAVEGNKIVVEHVQHARPPTPEDVRFKAAPLPGGFLIGGGVDLPDRHAERAKERDRAELYTLELSPAFTSPIRDRVLYD